MSSSHDDLTWRRDAVERVLALRSATLAERDPERVPIDEIAGRTLADAVTVDRDRPPRSHATMDGFAFDATDPYPLRIVGDEVYPEDDPPTIDQGDAVRIATGATLPTAANAVLKREEAAVDDGSLSGPPIDPGTYVYERGSNVAAGETLYTPGEQLAPRDALLLADLGLETVPVYRRRSVAILATGTEIHEGRSRDLDTPMLANLIRTWGETVALAGSVPDDADRVQSRIAALATEHDVVLTTGGTSVGHKDYVIRSLEALGDVLFHRVRVRPGKPIAVARLPDHDAVAFAIPGKPVGAHTIATLVARPFFTGDSSLPTCEASLARSVGLGPEGFEYVIPVILDDGTAMPLGHADSSLAVYRETFDPSVLSSATRAIRADGFVITETPLNRGQTVNVIPYPVVE